MRRRSDGVGRQLQLTAGRYNDRVATEGTLGSTNRHTTWDGSSAPELLPPGTKVGRYMLLESLGAGGMGAVYRAYDPKLRREIALKHVRCPPDQTETLLAEARAMAQLAHPALVSVYDADLEDGAVHIAMELVRGETLGAWLTSPRPWPRIVAMFQAIADGIEAAHAAGIVHRDVKPSNVLLDEDERPRIADFGLAVPDHASADEATWLQPDERLPALVVGTPPYMPPEQHRGARITAASDQYAFCVMLHEALYGERPFAPDADGDWLDAKSRGPGAMPTGTDVPRWLWGIVARGLAPDPADRWPSMRALEQALGVDPRRRRRRLALASATLGVLVGVPLVISWSEARAAELCRTEAEATRPWTSNDATRVSDALLATAAPYAPHTAEAVVERLDALALRWVDAHERWCVDATVQSTLAPADAVLVQACITERGRAIEANAARLIRDAPSLVEYAVELVADLDDPQACHDVPRLRLQPPLMAEIADTPAREAIGADLEAAEQALQRGERAEAATILGRAQATLRVDPWPRAEITASVLHGRIASGNGDLDAAAAAFRTATEQALAIGCDRCAIDTGLRLLGELAQTDTGAAAVPEWATILAGLIKRSGLAGDAAEASLYGTVGVAHITRAEPAPARDAFTTAAEIARATLGADHPETIAHEGNLAIALGALGQHDQALAAAERALEASTALYGEDHPRLAPLWQAIGRAHLGAERPEAAVAAMKHALDIEEHNRPDSHHARIIALNNLAVAYDDAGNYGGALRCAEQALAASIDSPPAERLLDLTNVGWYRYRLGDLEDAREVLEQGLALAREHPQAVRGGRSIRSNLARVYLELGRAEDAAPLARRALELGRDAWGEDDPRLADDYQALAAAELAIGHPDRARAALERAVPLAANDEQVQRRIETTRAALEHTDAESPEHEAAGSTAP